MIAAEQLSMTAHGTPGITIRGNSESCSEKEKQKILNHIHTSHKDIQRVMDKM